MRDDNVTPTSESEDEKDIFDVHQEPHFGACLVIGGCGFLGQHIVKFLLNEPTVTSIAVLSRSPFTNRCHKVSYHIGDITKPDQVRHIFQQVKPKVIFNTASPHAYIDHEHVLDNFYVNVDGNRNLLEAAAEIGTVKAFVYTSSGPIVASRGGGYDHADETKETLAVSRKGDPYHVAKAIGDQITLEANGKHGKREVSELLLLCQAVANFAIQVSILQLSAQQHCMEKVISRWLSLLLELSKMDKQISGWDTMISIWM